MKQIPLLIVLGLLLSACGGAPAPDLITSATTAATLTAQPTETPTPPATSTATPTATSAPTQTATPTETPEPTATPTPTPTGTPTPLPTFTLSGVVFFDYNGNGVRDEGEPPIPGATVQVGSLIATTGADGVYTLERVPRGNQQVRLSAPGFRYTALSLEAFQSSERPISVTVNGDIQRDWGMMQGFLTLPVKCGAPVEYLTFVDLDLGPGMRDWQGGNNTGKDNHYGIDYVMPEGQPIIASAPGIIVEAENTWPDVSTDPNLGLYDDGNRIIIYHGDGLYTFYAHLSNTFYVQPMHMDMNCASCERVSRGQVIALSGNTGALTRGAHLHFQFGGFGQRRIDPYRDVNNPNSISWWTKDNDPQCLP